MIGAGDLDTLRGGVRVDPDAAFIGRADNDRSPAWCRGRHQRKLWPSRGAGACLHHAFTRFIDACVVIRNDTYTLNVLDIGGIFMKRLCALALSLFTAGSAGQEVANAEGLVAVAQCYASCSLNRQRSFEYIGDATITLLEVGLTYEDRTQHLCALLENHVAGNDACYAGCFDIEKATGVRVSSARTRFITHLRRDRELLQEAGLWSNYKSISEPWFGSPEFEAACSQFFTTGLAESNGASAGLLHALPLVAAEEP